MKIDKMWNEFCLKNNIENVSYSAWMFGAVPDKLLNLVLEGKKRATSTALKQFELDNDPVPSVGDYSILLDSSGDPKCIIVTTKITIVPFLEVSSEHAYKEGEGDLSLAYWREAHEEFFDDEFKRHGLSFDESIEVFCEEFEVVYK